MGERQIPEVHFGQLFGHIKYEIFIHTKLLRYVSQHILAVKTLKSKVRFLFGCNVKTILSFKDTKVWKGNNISLHLMVHLRRPQYKTKNTSRKREEEQEERTMCYGFSRKTSSVFKKKNHCSNGIKKIYNLEI